MTFLSHPASQIRPQTVELNFVRFVALSAPIRTVLRQDLSADELAKVDRYLSVKAQDKALQVRFMLRRLLTEYVNGRIAPSAWCFDYGAKGKPCLSTELFAATQIVFNLSHSGDWLLIGMM
ncbi:MAG TPA: hypothetical protein VLA24_14495, partial [Pseudomonadales bacterium]|nr:hypothetical protein [Pseudomonadales bacterium]